MTELFLRIENLRLKKGSSYRELARICGVSPQNVQRWKSGGTIMPEHLNKLAVYFGVSIDHIMTGTISRNKDPETPTTYERELFFLRSEVEHLRTEIFNLREQLAKCQENLASALNGKGKHNE